MNLLISSDEVLRSGEVGCWFIAEGSLVGVLVLRVMWFDVSTKSDISCLLWSVVGEYHWW